MSKKQIILTADDYGACDYIDDAIIEAIKNGKINTVTAFVTHPDSKERIEKLIALRKNFTFNIGLHFSITSGFPLFKPNDATTLVDSTKRINGNFAFKLAKGLKLNKISKIEVKQELNQQLETLKSWLGNIPIDHVSNHHGIVNLEMEFFNVFVDAIKEFSDKHQINPRIPMRSPIAWIDHLKFLNYCSIEENEKALKRLSLPVSKEGIRLGFWTKFNVSFKGNIKRKIKKAETQKINFPDYMAVTFYGQAHYSNLVFLLEQFQNQDFSAEFMFHLAKGNRPPANEPHGINHGYFDDREKEFEILIGLDLDFWLEKFGIEKAFFNPPNIPNAEPEVPFIV